MYAKQLEGKSRKIMEIVECYVDEDKRIKYNTLFEFEVLDNETINGNLVVKGHHKK